MTADLITWLRAQLDEDERVATKADAMQYDLPSDAPWNRERIIADQLGGNSRVVAVHRIVAIFSNPARVLAEVEAKRSALSYLLEMRLLVAKQFSNDPSLTEPLTRSLLALAQPYAGRPGWRGEWALRP